MKDVGLDADADADAGSEVEEGVDGALGRVGCPSTLLTEVTSVARRGLPSLLNHESANLAVSSQVRFSTRSMICFKTS